MSAGFALFLALMIDRIHYYIKEVRMLRKHLEAVKRSEPKSEELKRTLDENSDWRNCEDTNIKLEKARIRWRLINLHLSYGFAMFSRKTRNWLSIYFCFKFYVNEDFLLFNWIHNNSLLLMVYIWCYIDMDTPGNRKYLMIYVNHWTLNEFDLRSMEKH